MKIFNCTVLLRSLCLFFMLKFLAFGFSEKACSQTLMIDDTAPRVTSIPSNGQDLSSTTYNYVRVPELIPVDSMKTDGTFYKHLLLTWAVGIDGAGPPVPPKAASASSVNAGSTWVSSSNTARIGSAMKTKSGKLVALDFPPTYVDQHNFPLVYWTSVNNGTTWTKHTDGMVQFTQTVLGIRMHKSMIEESDGTLYTSAYIRYSFSASFRTYVLKSVDGGKTWLAMLDGNGNPIEIDASGVPTDEGSLAVCPDGSWIMVMKQSTSDPDITLPILYSRSTNKGQSWSTPSQLSGAGAAASGKNPHVVLMANGVLALTYGTPDVEITFSADNGTTWTTPIATFPDPGGEKRPSGNTWIAPVGSNKLLQFGDNYAKTLNPNTQAIWQKEIEIVRPEQNRIDLRTKQSGGFITVMSPQTTLTYTTSAHPEARTTGAFDGSADYWSAALAPIGATSGVLQLDLQKTYRLQSIGMSMLYNRVQSATVELSPDNLTWTTVKTYTNVAHYCVNYTNITPFDARYVRVTVSGTGGQIGLGELELYESSSTFEANAAAETTEPHGILPTGYAVNGTSATQYGVSIQEGYGYQSGRALKLYDGSSLWRAGVKKIEAAGNTKTLEFRCRIAALPNGGSFNIPIIGTVSGVENIVFWVAVFGNGTSNGIVKVYVNGTAGWAQLGTATLPISGSIWKLVKIVANESANTASLYIDNVLMGTFGMYAAPANATTLTGFALNSAGTSPSGELVYFDDINFYDPSAESPSGVANLASQEKILTSALTAEVSDEVSKGNFAISISPNPADNIIRISLENSSKGPIQFYLIDIISGRTLKTFNHNLDGKINFLDTSILGLPSGLYVVTGKQNNHVAQTKLIVR